MWLRRPYRFRIPQWSPLPLLGVSSLLPLKDDFLHNPGEGGCLGFPLGIFWCRWGKHSCLHDVSLE